MPRWTLLMLAATLSGGLLALGHGLHPWWPVAWIAPLPLLVAALRANWRGALLASLVAGALQALGSLNYYVTTIGPAGAAAVVLLFAGLWALAVTTTRSLVVRLPAAVAVFAFPLAWAALDTLLLWASPHGGVGSLSTSQVAAPLVIQVAALGGSPAVVFLLCLPVSLAAVAIHRREVWRWRHAAAAGLIVAAALVFGFVRLSQPLVGRPVTVALAAIDRPAGDMNLHDRPPAIWDAYEATLSGLAPGAVDLILLPEAVDQPTPAREPKLIARLGALARAHASVLALGAVDGRAGRIFNRAWVFTADGLQVADYAKHHPAPGEASVITPGSGYATFPLKGQRLGVAICKDMDFAALPRAYRRLDVSALIVPASDFGQDDWMHARVAVLRGVEEGVAVIRAAEDGMLSVSDPYGRVVGSARSRPGGGALLVTTIRLGPPLATPYARLGEAFGWTCVAAIMLLAAVLAARELRRRRAA